MLKCVDLFAGAGGLSCGLGLAGFHTVLANELVPQYAETFKLNHPDTNVVVGDIRNVSEDDLLSKLHLDKGELDLLAGGPPCQGFSINAPVRSLDDERNHLFRDYLRVAKKLMPKFVLIENVPGIVSLGKGTVVQKIYDELEAIGYSVQHKILFAGHYGVPQTRFRTIIMASRAGYKFEFPEPEYNATAHANFTGAKELCFKIVPLFSQQLKVHTTVNDALSDLPKIEGGQINSRLRYATPANSTYQELLRNKDSEFVTNHNCSRLGPINMERLKHIPQGGSWRDIPHELLPKGLQRARRSDHTKRYGRLHPEGLCSTILTKCDPHWGSFFHPYYDRVISVREAARIQSFPDSYEFTGNITQQYEQVGNAVPPFMAKAIGERISEAIKNHEKHKDAIGA